MSNSKYSIGIIGGGVVGKAVASFFGEVKIYDKYNEIHSIDDVLKKDIIFICVPTPYENGFDISALEDVFSHFKDQSQERIVVIKSTSIPGTTDYFQKKYSHLKILFNPEFLTEKTSNKDFIKPDKQLVGYTEKSKDIAGEVLSILPFAPYKKSIPAKVAELVKYATNSFYATKVIFGNLLYDISESLGVDYEQVHQAFASDQRICDSHFDAIHGGYRGYGGKCLPKDIRALRDFGESKNVDVSLLKILEEINKKYKDI